MKIVLAPDSFKESMTAKEVCIAMEKGIRNVRSDVEIVHSPMGDGGEGTLEALVDATDGSMHTLEVTSPLGDKVIGRFGILGDNKTAVIEIAEASGLHLVNKEKRNPLIATSYGTGELIKEALDKGVSKIIIGLGGSATNDGGVGMLQALGVSFKDCNNNEIPFGGGNINKIEDIDISNFDKRIFKVKIEVACDVNNPLTGKNGASEVFARQKGADSNIVKVLDENLVHLAKKVKDILDKDINNVPGAGAAGGIGAALVGFCNGEMKSGIDTVIKYSKLEDKIKDADYVFTGEGSIDFQTKYGKTPIGVAKIAKKYEVPVIAFAGKVGKGIEELYEMGITSVIGILPEIVTIEEALKSGKLNLERSVQNVSRLLFKMQSD